MFFNRNKKIQELKSLFLSKHPTWESKYLLTTSSLRMYGKFHSKIHQRRKKAERLIETVNRSNAYQAEQGVREYLKYIKSLNSTIEHFDNVIMDIQIIAEKMRDEMPLHRNELSEAVLKEVVYGMRRKCTQEVSNLRNQIHLIAETPSNLSQIRVQKADSLYQEYQRNIQTAKKVEKEKKQREFEERQKEKALGLARLKEEEEKRLDLDRDKQIAQAQKEFDAKLATSKKQFQNQIAAYDSGVQKELEQYKKELALKYHKLDEKEAMIEQFLKEKQTEMYNKMVQQSDNIINDLAEQKAAEILKKLGIKL